METVVKREPLEYTVEQAEALWSAARVHFKDGPIHLQIYDDTPRETREILRAQGFDLTFVPLTNPGRKASA
jgi:hypothetical protein